MASPAQKVLVSIANGTKLMEAVITINVLRRTEADVTVASVEKQLRECYVSLFDFQSSLLNLLTITSLLLLLYSSKSFFVSTSMAGASSALAKRMWCSVPERLQLHGAMLALQFGYAGFHVVPRATLNMAICKLVFPVYRNKIALLLLLPLTKVRPALTLNFLVQFFQLALVGITTNQGFYLLGLDNTSPTFVSAIQNFVPAITFLMAALLRIEKVRQDRKDDIGKVVGTIFCVARATVITLYKRSHTVLW